MEPVNPITNHPFMKPFFDIDLITGGIGAMLAIFFPFVDIISHFLQVLGAAAGVVLVFLSIIHKRMQIKALKEQREKKNNNDEE